MKFVDSNQAAFKAGTKWAGSSGIGLQHPGCSTEVPDDKDKQECQRLDEFSRVLFELSSSEFESHLLQEVFGSHVSQVQLAISLGKHSHTTIGRRILSFLAARQAEWINDMSEI